MQKKIDTQWLHNMTTHAQTTDMLAQVNEAMFATNMDRHIDVVRLRIENQLQLILLLGLAARADRADILRDIRRRGEFAQELTHEATRTAALEVVHVYQDILGDTTED